MKEIPHKNNQISNSNCTNPADQQAANNSTWTILR